MDPRPFIVLRAVFAVVAVVCSLGILVGTVMIIGDLPGAEAVQKRGVFLLFGAALGIFSFYLNHCALKDVYYPGSGRGETR